MSLRCLACKKYFLDQKTFLSHQFCYHYNFVVCISKKFNFFSYLIIKDKNIIK